MLLLSVVLLLGAACALPTENFIPYIVNGTKASRGEFPFQVSVQCRIDSTTAYYCGGTILNENWIMTAGHCGVEYTNYPTNCSIEAGSTILHGDEAVRRTVEQVIVHEHYNPADDYINDISVMKLSTPLPFGELISAVKLPAYKQQTEAGTPATVIGWGLPYSGGSLAHDLYKVDIMVYSDKECTEIHQVNIHDSNICAGVREGGKGQCSGDSGGPLLASGVQVGIVSWSVKPCAVKPYPGVFTEVSYFINWLKDNGALS